MIMIVIENYLREGLWYNGPDHAEYKYVFNKLIPSCKIKRDRVETIQNLKQMAAGLGLGAIGIGLAAYADHKGVNGRTALRIAKIPIIIGAMIGSIIPSLRKMRRLLELICKQKCIISACDAALQVAKRMNDDEKVTYWIKRLESTKYKLSSNIHNIKELKNMMKIKDTEIYSKIYDKEISQ